MLTYLLITILFYVVIIDNRLVLLREMTFLLIWYSVYLKIDLHSSALQMQIAVF